MTLQSLRFQIETTPLPSWPPPLVLAELASGYVVAPAKVARWFIVGFFMSMLMFYVYFLFMFIVVLSLCFYFTFMFYFFVVYIYRRIAISFFISKTPESIEILSPRSPPSSIRPGM